MAQKSDLEQLLDDMEPVVRDAFRDAIRDVVDQVVISALTERIAAGDLDGAAAMIDLDPAVFGGVADAAETTYRDAGVLTAEAQRAVRTPLGARLIVRFTPRNPVAEEWLRTNSSRLVVGLSRTARQTVRQTLETGMRQGRNPRSTALDLVGRQSRLTGRREGGTIGLTPQQQSYVESARAELLSGDPAQLRHYLGRRRRDSRFDARVRRALENGTAVSAEDVEKMLGRYADRLLQLRGETIARTETILSLHAGQAEAMRQAVSSGKISEEDITKIWRHVADGRVRHSHVLLGGRKVAFSEPFVSPTTGARMMHPGDRSLGATGEDVVNCRCHAEYKVDYVAAAIRRRRGRVIS